MVTMENIMKKIILASAAVVALAAASPAFAGVGGPGTGPFPQDDEGAVVGAGAATTTNYEVEGANPAKCAVTNTSAENEVVLAPNKISNAAGFADSGLAGEIATGLSNLGTLAWCTGTKNAVNLYRTALSTGSGAPTSGGFRTSVIYDLNVNIVGATRALGGPVSEGTSDGIGNGPGVGVGAGNAVSAFGPSGGGAAITFVQEPGSTVQAADIHSTGSETRGSFTTSTNRLLAGFYEGEVTLVITPGV
jgi:hypothetical protein